MLIVSVNMAARSAAIIYLLPHAGYGLTANICRKLSQLTLAGTASTSVAYLTISI